MGEILDTGKRTSLSPERIPIPRCQDGSTTFAYSVCSGTIKFFIEIHKCTSQMAQAFTTIGGTG